MSDTPLPRLDLLGHGSDAVIFWHAIPSDQAAALCFPTEKSHRENKVMSLIDHRARIINPAALTIEPDATYLSYFIYQDDQRLHGVTDWAVERFRDHYGDAIICQSDIFYYTYAMLHHPQNSGTNQNAAPTIPLLPEFWQISDAGRSLTAVHLFPGEDDAKETERIASSLPLIP